MGGPARQDAPKAVEALKRLNVPYLVSLPLVFQTTEEWMDSELGLHPVQVALQVTASASTFHLSADMHAVACNSLAAIATAACSAASAFATQHLASHSSLVCWPPQRVCCKWFVTGRRLPSAWQHMLCRTHRLPSFCFTPDVPSRCVS